MHTLIKQSFADADNLTGSQQEILFWNHTMVLLEYFVNNFGIEYVMRDVQRAYLDW